MRETAAPVVLITGASAGIGEALAFEYSARGADLVLLARRTERLASVADRLTQAGRRVLAITCDVRNEEQLRGAFEHALRTFGRIDTVIANAGLALTGRFEKLTVDDYRRQFEINVFALLGTARLAIDPLKAARGRLALVSSVAGYVAAPGTSPYAMSKFAVRALGDSIRAELRPYGISVTTLCPGFIESEIRKVGRDGVYRPDARDPVPEWLVVPVRPAAKQMVRAIESRRAEVVITGHGKAFVFLARHMPRVTRVLARALTRELRNP
jgi:short-subunit dehydrogenase